MFISHTLRTQFGPARCSEPPPISFPADADGALALAGKVDRQADEAFRDGRLDEADRLTHLCIELTARATTGARA